MKYIPLTKGKYAIVDDDDFEYLNQWKWCMTGFYAGRGIGNYKNRGRIYLHRVIMGEPKGSEVDHINFDKLDNRKSNLRVCSKADNRRHVGLRKNNTSGFKGVSWHKLVKKWYATIQVDGKQISKGWFENRIDAAKEYDRLSKKYHGDFAHLNLNI